MSGARVPMRNASGEKKYFQLPNPFRRFSEKQVSRPNSEARHLGRRRVSSVYLPNDSSASGFIVVPEFDGPVLRTQTTRIHDSEDPNHSPHLPKLPAVTSFKPLSSNSVDSYIYGVEPMSLHHSSYLAPGPYYTSIPNTSRVDDSDFSQRLSSAYEHIRSMPSVASPNISLSSDPQMLRKQLGVPQHSVLNYPIHSWPDLPNPHTFTEPMFPKLPPAASPDESYGTSKKLGLRISTNVYPPSPRRSPSGPFLRAQRNSLATAPILTETSRSQCHTLEAAWSAQAGTARATPKPRPSVSSPSKLIKHRVEKPIVSSSSLPSSRRRALKAVLRKPVTVTAPSTNVHEWQISLPQIRPPSPFKVDIPLHHTWHDRRINLLPSLECRPVTAQFQETDSHRTGGNTEVLASLAWIGTPPMRSSSYTTNPWRHLSNPALSDHLSMAIAVEDDSISDDALVDRLEKVRRAGAPERDISPSFSPDNLSGAGGDENELLHTSYPRTCNRLITQDTVSDLEDADVWHTARKALLCIREIIRTEKKYQEAIKLLSNAQTATPPPPTMVPYISALVRTSETLLKSFLEDPSAWGISTAFVTSEDELEATMVSWCAVAGTFFMDENDPQSSGLMGRWRHRKSGVPSPSSSMTHQTSVSLSSRFPPMLPVIGTTDKIKDRVERGRGALRHATSEQERRTAFHSLQQSENTKNQMTGQPPSRKLSVRDLAIQPVQRVMRYVLLYRDLLDCTPSISPSRLLVERAVEAAMRIANRCDSAQRNPAFFHVP